MIAALAALCACVVERVAYYKLLVPKAQYLRDECYGSSGAPSLVYYAYDDIYVSLDLPSREFVELGLHVPEGVTAALEDNRVRIAGVTADGRAIEAVALLEAVPHGAFGTNEPRTLFLWRPDPYRAPVAYGPLRGRTLEGRYLWYLFAAYPIGSKEIPPNLVRGSITLPPIRVNGRDHASQVIPFEAQQASGLTPVNC